MTDKQTDKLLDEMFQAAAREAPQPSSELIARVLQDANTAQPAAAQARAPGRAAPVWLEALGGWGGLGGLVAASSFGLWLGMSAGLGLGNMSDALALMPSTAALDADYTYLADMGDF